MGGNGTIVETDETYFGPVEEARPCDKHLPPFTKRGRFGRSNKRTIVAQVKRAATSASFTWPWPTR